MPGKLPLPIVLAAAILLGCAALGCDGLLGPRVTAYFKDAKMLGVGDPVVQNGIIIGKVTAIKPLPDGRIEVWMRLDRKNAEFTRKGSLAYIAPADGGRQRVELYPAETGGAPLAGGDRLEGVETQLELQLRRAAGAIAPALSALQKQVGQTARDLDAYLKSPEGQRLTGQTRDFLRGARDRVTSQVERFRAEHPDFQKNLVDQLEKARREGNKALIKVLEELEKTLKAADGAAGDPEKKSR